MERLPRVNVDTDNATNQTSCTQHRQDNLVATKAKLLHVCGAWTSFSCVRSGVERR